MRMRRTLRLCLTFLSLTLFTLFLSVSVFGTEPETEPETSTPVQEGVYVKKVSSNYYLYDKATNKKVQSKTGIQEYPAGSGNYYYFRNTSGKIYASRWITKDKKYYYADQDGVLKKGWQTINNKIYYFNTKTFARTTGWKKIKGKYYYFTTKGTQVTKWLKWKKYTYYLNPADNNAKTIGWKTISKKKYYFNSKGRLATGWFTVDGEKYYSNKNGIRQTGLQTINGKTYYLDKSKNGAMKTGWITVNGKTYYMSNTNSKKGQAITGWMNLSGSYYLFNNNGVMQKGWLTVGTKKYYLNPTTGKMTKGKATIDGKSYDFGTKGYIDTTPTGPWNIKVNLSTNVVTVYRGTTPVKALLCSTGANGATPAGNFKLLDKLRWHTLMGPSYGQYCSHITSDILFHSVPYNRPYDIRSLTASSYNALGRSVSHGCIRLNIASAMYLYQNCPIGTPVKVFWGSSKDDPLGRPYVAPIPASQTWDPTDPAI